MNIAHSDGEFPRILTTRECVQVAWLDQKSFPLTYEDRRVIDDSRFSLIRPEVKEWNLQIREVRLEDEGLYRCTVNTNPVRNKLIMLFVRGDFFS